MTDILIVGAGVAGLTAAMYAVRAGLSCVVLERLFCGGQINNTYEIDNYPGFVEPISGLELAEKFEAHAKKHGASLEYADIDTVDILGDTKIVKAGDSVYKARAVILAMGAVPKTLGLARETELCGSGVSYCATCDGAFYSDKVVAVVGGGNTAVEDALFLGRICRKVYIVHRRDKLRADKLMVERVIKNTKIEVIWNSEVLSINGDKVESIEIGDVSNSKRRGLKVDGLFVAVGVCPTSGLVSGVINMDSDGYIVTDDQMRTNVVNVYAVGDIRRKRLRQIVTAVSDGAIAASMIARGLYEG